MDVQQLLGFADVCTVTVASVQKKSSYSKRVLTKVISKSMEVRIIAGNEEGNTA